MPVVIRMPAFGGIGRQGASRREPRDLVRAHRGAEGGRSVDARRTRTGSFASRSRTPTRWSCSSPRPATASQGARRLTVEGPAIGRRSNVRAGDDVALVAYGAMVHRCLEAADALAAEGVEARVLDLRSLSPLDVDAIGARGARVRRDGRRPRGTPHPRDGRRDRRRSRPSTLSTRLDAPVARVTGWDTPYPPGRLEHDWLPAAARIAEAARRTLA